MIICFNMRKERDKKDITKIGVISDTHGLFRPEVGAALREASLIIHAGDIGSPLILQQLDNIAPVLTVRGNMDGGEWACKLQKTESIEQNSKLIYVIHDSAGIDLDPAAAKIDVVISGHSHRPSISRHKGILYLNPGSAGPRRFNLAASVAMLYLCEQSVYAEIITLKIK